MTGLCFFLMKYIYIYIYIYCHPQTDCFVISQLFSVARHTRCFKLGLETWLTLYRMDNFFRYIFTYRLLATRVHNIWEELLHQCVCGSWHFLIHVLNSPGGKIWKDKIFRVSIYSYKINRLIGLMGRVFTNGPGDWGSIPGWIMSKTLKMVLDTSLLNTQHYKVCIKCKVKQSRRRSSALPYKSV